MAGRRVLNKFLWGHIRFIGLRLQLTILFCPNSQKSSFGMMKVVDFFRLLLGLFKSSLISKYIFLLEQTLKLALWSSLKFALFIFICIWANNRLIFASTVGTICIYTEVPFARAMYHLHLTLYYFVSGFSLIIPLNNYPEERLNFWQLNEGVVYTLRWPAVIFSLPRRYFTVPTDWLKTLIGDNTTFISGEQPPISILFSSS